MREKDRERYSYRLQQAGSIATQPAESTKTPVEILRENVKELLNVMPPP
jgi:hypothetical protein